MREPVALVRAILGRGQCDDQAAKSFIEDAERSGTDLFGVLAHRTGLSEAQVYERAAAFCGLPFSPQVPRELGVGNDTPRLEHLGSLSSVRGTLYDREVLFIAPPAAQMVAVGARRHSHPGLFNDICVVPPPALRQHWVRQHGGALTDYARQNLSRLWPFASAHLDLTRNARWAFVILLAALVTLAASAPFRSGGLPAVLLLCCFLPGAWMRVSALLEESAETEDRVPLLADADLPVYSVLIPLRDETAMVPQLVRAMRALDYPPEKLDIKFVVEETSTRTVDAVRHYLDDPRFELIEVPEAPPHTKPKALNFALPLVQGDHVVIYDAEDLPEPDQLRKAASRFAAEPATDCLQAELVIDNGGDSWLSALFAAEYSGLFGVMVPALGRWRVPVPLGGTSNHFRTARLREIGGWDAFNVTEDADLGLRLARRGLVIDTLHSRTREEAPTEVGAWLRQRTRWMKGWMQTFIVHNRRPVSLLRDLGWRNFLAMQFYIGGMILSAPLHLIFSIALFGQVLLTPDLHVRVDGALSFVFLFVFTAGYLGTGALSIAGALRLGQVRLLVFQLLLPVYWALVGVAAFRAMYELITRPYFWAKTTHGLAHRPGIAANAMVAEERRKWSGQGR